MSLLASAVGKPAPEDPSSIGTSMVFRGDGRSPEQIKAAGGFRTRGPPESDKAFAIREHVEHLGDPHFDTVYVSATDKIQEAYVFATAFGDGYVYEIQKTPNAIDVNRSYRMAGRVNVHSDEFEHLFLGGVSWSQIRGWQEVRSVGGSLYPSRFVPNPDFNEQFRAFSGSGGQPDLLEPKEGKKLQDEADKFMSSRENVEAKAIGGGNEYAPSFCTQSRHSKRNLKCIPRYGLGGGNEYKTKWGEYHRLSPGSSKPALASELEALLHDAKVGQDGFVKVPSGKVTAVGPVKAARVGKLLGLVGVLQLATGVSNSVFNESIAQGVDGKALESFGATLKSINHVAERVLRENTAGYDKLKAPVDGLDAALETDAKVDTLLSKLPNYMAANARSRVALFMYLLRNLPVAGEMVHNVEAALAKEEQFHQSHPQLTTAEALEHNAEFAFEVLKGSMLDILRNWVPGFAEIESNADRQTDIITHEITHGHQLDLRKHMAQMWLGVLRDLKNHYVPLAALVEDGSLSRGNRTTRALADRQLHEVNSPSLLMAAVIEAMHQSAPLLAEVDHGFAGL